MRIQETDNILKEARFSRKNAMVHEGGQGRAWNSPMILAAAALAIVVAIAGVFAWRRWS